MITISFFHQQIIDKEQKIKAILFLFAVFSLVAPFTGFLEFQSNMVLYFNRNLITINQFPTDINPIFLLLQLLMYEFNLLIEFLLPKFWGTNNYFFMRFAFKLPLFIFFIADAFLVEKIIYSELFNIPLIYTTFILGTPESITFFFILLSFCFLLQVKINDSMANYQKTNIFYAGFFLGIAISFSYSLILIIFAFIPRLKVKEIIIYLMSISFSIVLVFIPFILFDSTRIQFFEHPTYGIENLFSLLNMDTLGIYILLLEILIITILTFRVKFSSLERLLVYSTIIVILTYNLSLSDFFVFLQLFILGLLNYSNFDYDFKLKSIVIHNLPNKTFFFSLIFIYICYLIFLYLVFQISDVVYLKIIELGPIGVYNRSLWSLNKMLEFNVLFYIIFSLLLFVTSILVLKKEKFLTGEKIIEIK